MEWGGEWLIHGHGCAVLCKSIRSALKKLSNKLAWQGPIDVHNEVAVIQKDYDQGRFLQQ